ncbi:interferon-induced protein 35 [Scyliorhinus canicula]|uniref:interferon-induced protein 35 n=1 Tax=Scyliorhinus canicula TaxID=7830 RepID=UPI0018F2B44E|nr:interferon-induced protein 35 [Scyliorhinus canicula]
MDFFCKDVNMDDASKLKACQQEILHRKAQHTAVQKDIADLEKTKHDLQHTAMELSIRTERLQESIESDKLGKQKQDLILQKQMDDTMVEIDSLLKEQSNVREELTRIEEERSELEKQLKVSYSMPQKRWIFTGSTNEDGQRGVAFDIKPHIRYPIEGGSAVITLEDEAVADKILEMEEHVIPLADCRLKIKSHPLKLQMLEDIEIKTRVCKKRILISEIPKGITSDQLLDKLELHFSKQKNFGGEVDHIELLEDSGNVVITFAAEGIAENLTKREFQHMEFRGIDKRISLRVSPFIKGEIVNLTVGEVVSRKSVLFTGIPDIMDEELLQDSLEIHFQKESNGGGEVDQFAYIPEGKSGIVCFEADNETAE